MKFPQCFSKSMERLVTMAQILHLEYKVNHHTDSREHQVEQLLLQWQQVEFQGLNAHALCTVSTWRPPYSNVDTDAWLKHGEAEIKFLSSHDLGDRFDAVIPEEFVPLV